MSPRDRGTVSAPVAIEHMRGSGLQVADGSAAVAKSEERGVCRRPEGGMSGSRGASGGRRGVQARFAAADGA